LEHINASPDPYQLVNIATIPLTAPPRPAPSDGAVNPSPHVLQASVTVTQDNNRSLATVSVTVWRPQDSDPAALVTLSTVPDKQQPCVC
jgi:hypothetical protein